MGTYNDAFQSILKNCESQLGVYKTVDGSMLESLPIVEFYDEFTHMRRSKEEKRDACIKCGMYMASLTYINFKSNYRSTSVLDFSAHGRVDLLANLLIPFLKRKNVTSLVKDNIKSLVKYLELLEERNKDFIYSLSYRYIRLFIIFMIYGDYSHAGIVAELILNQLFISENVDKAIKMKIEEVVYARREIDKISNKYVGFKGEARKSYKKFKMGVKETVTNELFKDKTAEYVYGDEEPRSSSKASKGDVQEEPKENDAPSEANSFN
ncbi:hypothetical protein [Clostridium paraputrificum]|uniref:Uncharacterized protein n=2 Tax=Clostridium paraputrificum TaxID=29363 RepID=A0A6N3F111_9CLOT